MGIQESLEILKRVQEVDREIYGFRRELVTAPEAEKEIARALESEKARMVQLEAALKEAQLKQKKKEGELAEKETQIRKYDSQLTQVKTNKEYSALQQEMVSLKADCSMLEDSILTVFDEIERAQKAVREEKERLVQVEKESEKKRQEIAARISQLKSQLTGLEEKRKGIISQVLPETRELYEKIVEKKEGLALVSVAGEACGACRLEIRPQLLNEIRLGESLVVCENCHRILYIE